MAQWASFSPLLALAFLGTSIFLFPVSNAWKAYAFILIASFNYALWKDIEQQKSLVPFENKEVQIQGIVTSFPDQRIANNRISLKAEKINGKSINTNSEILLITDPATLLHYGNEIQFTGKLSRPRNFQGFDYQKYLDRFGISHIIRSPAEILILNENKGQWTFRIAEKIRNTLEQNLNKNLSSPHSTIAMGILLGVKKELPPPIKSDFKDSGLMHILVVSGFNISVIMVLSNYLFRRLGPKINLGLSMLVIGFFVLMTGAEAPVVRAAIMGSLVGMAMSNGQFSESKNVLLFSAVIMGILNPKVVQADLGFFFSFAATAGIILLVPTLTPYFQWLTNRLEFRNIFLVTLSSQIAVFPIQTYFFGQFPTGGLLANQLTEPVIPLAMFFSSIVAILGFLPDVLLKFLSVPAWFALQFLLSVANFFAHFPVIPIPTSLSSFLGTGLLGLFIWANICPSAKTERTLLP